MNGAERLARIRELFDRMLALPEAERREQLMRLSEDDAFLRDEVVQLLEIDDGISKGTTGNVAMQLEFGQGAAWLAEHVAAAEATEFQPTHIGKFEIVRVLGHGSMGMVYEARQSEPARAVALKVLHRGILSAETARRFEREARALASLRHPGVVALFEVGRAPLSDGLPPQPYLAMELVDGRTLRAELSRHTMTIEQRLELVAMLCEAVHAAHQKGIVHRDIKPENVVLTPLSEGASLTKHHPGVQPKIFDFGVSQLVEQGGSVAREVVGTAPYISPEQARGELTDTRTDIYALGVIAFELLSGTWPIDVKGLSASDALRRVLMTEPQKLEALSPGLHADVYSIVAKAMHADPAMRYSSAAELCRDVRRFLSHQPILARRHSPGYILSRFVRRHRALAALSGAALTLLLASLVVMAYLWTDAKRTRSDAIWESYRARMSAASVNVAADDVASARAALESAPETHRGWEYRHFVSRLDESVRTIAAPDTGAWSIVPEADGTAVLVSTDEVKRIELATGALSPSQPDERLRLYYGAKAATFPRFMRWSEQRVFSPGAGTGVTAHTVAAWPAWTYIRVVAGTVSRDDGVMALVLTSHDRNEVVVIDLGEGTSMALGLADSERVLCVGLSNDGSRLVLAGSELNSQSQQIRLVDVYSMRELARTDSLERPVHALAMEPNGRRFVIMLQSGELQRWSIDGDSLTRLQRASFDQDAAAGMAFSPDGLRFACGSRDGLVRVFDTESLAIVSAQRGHEREIVSVCCLPAKEPNHAGSASSMIASTGLDGRVRLWDWSAHRPSVVSLRGHQHLVHGLAYGPISRQVWTGSWDKSIATYDADTGERLATTSTPEMVLSIAISHDEQTLVSRELGGAVRLWNAATLGLLQTVPFTSVTLDAPAFDDSDTYVILEPPQQSKGFRVWNARTEQIEILPSSELRRFSATWISHSAGVLAVTEPRDGERMSVLFDIETGAERLALPTVRAADESIAFAPNGEMFAAPGNDHTITLYSTHNYMPIGEFRGHTREVLAMVFSPDGRRFFSADLTGVIRVWDVPTRQEVGQLHGHGSHLRRLLVTPDGVGLVSGARDGEARVWWAPEP